MIAIAADLLNTDSRMSEHAALALLPCQKHRYTVAACDMHAYEGRKSVYHVAIDTIEQMRLRHACCSRNLLYAQI